MQDRIMDLSFQLHTFNHRVLFISRLISFMDMESTLDFWKEKFWSLEKCPWHLCNPHVGLLTYGDKLFDSKSSRVLVPLCGKTVDLKWIYNQGHTVVGVEGKTVI